MDNSATGVGAFWAFSLEVYARAQVADLCVALQDDYGFDVNLLLLGLWLAQTERTVLNAHSVTALRDAAAPLNDNLVHPLRRVRRWAKPSDPVAEAARSRLYGAIKQVELQAEHLVQMTLIEALRASGNQDGGSQPTPQAAAGASFEAYREAIGAPANASALLGQLIVRALA